MTEMQGVTLNYGIPSAYQFVRNNEAGAITKNVGDTGFYYRLPLTGRAELEGGYG